jgi:hypothetical protein
MRTFAQFAIFVAGILFTTVSQGCSTSVWSWYSDDQITFSYPSFAYNAPIAHGNEREKSDIFEIIDINKNYIDGVDSITVCKGDLKKCALIKDFDKPYWLEETSGRLIIFNPTEIFASYKNKFGKGYEIFPLCGWVDKHGVSSQYGGQCYVILVSNGKKTISFNFLIGENVGARLLKTKYIKQINMYRRIADSAR